MQLFILKIPFFHLELRKMCLNEKKNTHWIGRNNRCRRYVASTVFDKRLK